MSDRVQVSVVIAVPDARAGIQEALGSVLASDLHELEVIMVESGPTDHSPIVGAARDPRVVTVRLRPGRGTQRSRNLGIARARAPYVAFLDPDDLLKPNALSATVSALDRNPEAGLAFSDFESIDEAGATVTRTSAIAGFSGFRTLASESREGSWRLIRQADLARALLYENFIAASGVVVRRQLLTEIGPFDESVPCCADLDLWFRLAHRCDALYSSEIGHSRRARAASSTGEKHTASEDCITVLRRERERWSDRGAQRQLDRLIAQHLASIGYDERQRRHRLRSGAMFAYAFATSPQVRWLKGMLQSILY